MAKTRPDYHPAVPGPYSPPTGDLPDYIKGADACAGFGTRDFFVAWIPRRQADEMIIANHYSGRVVRNAYVHLGVFLAGRLVGALQFGHAINPKAMAGIVAGTTTGTYLELNRMWLDDVAPRNSESRAIAYAVRYIRRVCPRVRWIQTFADERLGRWGVVYQASNFLFVGSHLCHFYELDGQTFHPMLLTAHGPQGGPRGQYLRANLHRATRHTYRQFRYVLPLHPAARRGLLLKPRPYPKPEMAFNPRLKAPSKAGRGRAGH